MDIDFSVNPLCSEKNQWWWIAPNSLWSRSTQGMGVYLRFSYYMDQISHTILQIRWPSLEVTHISPIHGLNPDIFWRNPNGFLDWGEAAMIFCEESGCRRPGRDLQPSFHELTRVVVIIIIIIITIIIIINNDSSNSYMWYLMIIRVILIMTW